MEKNIIKPNIGNRVSIIFFKKKYILFGKFSIYLFY